MPFLKYGSMGEYPVLLSMPPQTPQIFLAWAPKVNGYHIIMDALHHSKMSATRIRVLNYDLFGRTRLQGLPFLYASHPPFLPLESGEKGDRKTRHFLLRHNKRK